jgi:DNA-3-methyladenine glycosylase I
MEIIEVRPKDRDWIRALLRKAWGGETVVIRGHVFRPCQLPGFIAVREGRPAGLVTYRVEGDDAEVVTLNSLRTGMGIGTALLGKVEETAREASCRRLRVVTTNDNRTALRFYRNRGYRKVAVRRGAVTEARKQKPEIPLRNPDGIPIEDEIELAKDLGETRCD